MKNYGWLLFTLLANISIAQHVGIGIASPMAPLHAKATAGEVLRLQSNDPLIGFFDNGNNYIGYLWANRTTGNDFRIGSAPASNVPIVLAPNGVVSFTAAANGNIGLGDVINPTSPLQFPNTSATRKLVFWQNTIAAVSFAGIGNNTGNLLYQAADVSYDHVFSTYAGSGSNDIMRIKGTGKVGILVPNPTATFEVGGRIRLRSNVFDGGTSGIWFTNIANSADAALLSMENNDQGIGIRSANTLRFLVNTVNGNVGIGTANPVAPLTFANNFGDKIVLQDFGVTGQFALRTQSQLLQIATPQASDEVAIGYGTGAGFVDKFRITALGKVGIGTSMPIGNLDVISKSLWSQLTLASTNTPGYGKIDFISDYGLINQWRQAYMISGDAGNFTGVLSMYTNGEGIANKNGSVMALQLRNGAALTSTGTVGVFSDERLKTNITPFTDGLKVIEQINPIQFQYKPGAPFTTNEEQVGIIAQELEKVAPYMVNKTTENGVDDLRWVNNQAYIFLLINAVKELKTTLEIQVRLIAQQQQEIDRLKKRLD